MIQDMEVSGILPRAADRYRVIAFDRPGFGYSERPRSTIWTPSAQAELLQKALAMLGVERPIVVGHSWGSLVALALALDYPADIAAIVLLSGYYFPTPRADAVLSSPPAIPIIGDVMRYSVSPFLGRAMTPAVVKTLFGPSSVPKRFEAFPVEMALRPSQIRATAADTALMIPAAAFLSQRYGELALPVVIVAGDGDKIADFQHQSVRLHDVLPESILVCVPNAGHMIHYTDPDLVLAAIDLAAERSAE
jgi:pimeloyl-ACP methyl ester carboxylesterase